MRTIHLTQRTARMLRENLVGNQAGYQYPELLRLDRIARQLTEIQGDYDTKIIDLVRQERQLRRRAVRATTPVETAEIERELLLLAYDAEDAHEAAAGVAVRLEVEDSDWRLIGDKIDGVGQWQANDAIRPLVLAMVEAVRDAESDELEAEPRQIRRR